MSEFSAIAVQTVNPGESVVFTANPVPCRRGFVRWRDESPNFLLSGNMGNRCVCTCVSKSAKYHVDFGANIAVPTGETVGPISVAIAVDGTTLPESTMISTPAAVEEFNSVSKAVTIDIWRGCCQTVTVRNTSSIPILVQNAVINFSRPDLAVSY